MGGKKDFLKNQKCPSLTASREVPPAWSVAAQSGVWVVFFIEGSWQVFWYSGCLKS